MDLDYYRMSPGQRLVYKISNFFKSFGKGLAGFFVRIYQAVIGFFVGIGRGLREFGLNFWRGDALTKSSHVFMGLSHLFRGQVVRGIVYLFLEAAFVLYMVFFGGNYLAMCFENFIGGGNVGRTETQDYWNEEEGIYDKLIGDNSFLILLYGILTLFVIAFFIICYFNAAKESYTLEQYNIIGKKPQAFKKDISNLLDNKFHITLLSLPMVGLFVFTVVPLVTMILHQVAEQNPDSVFLIGIHPVTRGAVIPDAHHRTGGTSLECIQQHLAEAFHLVGVGGNNDAIQFFQRSEGEHAFFQFVVIVFAVAVSQRGKHKHIIAMLFALLLHNTVHRVFKEKAGAVDKYTDGLSLAAKHTVSPLQKQTSIFFSAECRDVC